MTRVLICDDQDVVHEGLRAILGTAPGIEAIGDAAAEMAQTQRPAMVLMDLNISGVNGIQWICVLTTVTGGEGFRERTSSISAAAPVPGAHRAAHTVPPSQW